MINKNSLLSLFLMFMASLLSAQTVPEGINYQALFRAQDGSPITNQQVQVEVNLLSGEEVPEVYYQELHDLRTDELGLLIIPIGQGKYPLRKLSEVPWAKGNIWLSINMLEEGHYRELVKNELLSVPYAMHANSAEELTAQGELSLRQDNSIYWLTSGNSKSVPHVHFIGTADKKAFFIKTDNETRIVIDTAGLVTMYGDNSNIMGPDTDKSSYPFIIERGRQGIYIELDVDRVNSGNNFLTFADPLGIHGAVEGQTLAECFTYPFYLIDKALTIADIALAIAGIKGQFDEAAKVSSDGFGALAAPGAIINGLANIANLTYLLYAQARDIEYKVRNIGVLFRSGGADYAEWIPKVASERVVLPGEVIGIKNGKASLNTVGADHLMVVSGNPIFEGNTPEPGQEKDFVRAAFMGQVYTAVFGTVRSGDYILPSGNNDGLAMAVHPADMLAGDYKNIIGVAWDSSDTPDLVHPIKVAVGINANDLSEKIAELEIRAENIYGLLTGEIPLGKDISNLPTVDTEKFMKSQPQTRMDGPLSNEEFDALVDTYDPVLKFIYTGLEEMLAENDLLVSDYPVLQEQFEDPVAFLKALKRDERYASQVAILEWRLLHGNN